MDETIQEIMIRIAKTDTKKLLRLYTIIKNDFFTYNDITYCNPLGISKQDFLTLKINYTQIKYELEKRGKLNDNNKHK